MSGASPESIRSILSEVAEYGTYYTRLSHFSLQPVVGSMCSRGLVFQVCLYENHATFTKELRVQNYRLRTPQSKLLKNLGVFRLFYFICYSTGTLCQLFLGKGIEGGRCEHLGTEGTDQVLREVCEPDISHLFHIGPSVLYGVWQGGAPVLTD